MSLRQCNYRKAVVLGAGGFIGINLVQALVQAGFDVVCFARKASPHWPAEVTPLVGDFAQLPDALLDHMHEAVVFHLVSSCKPNNGTAGALTELNADVGSTIRYLDATEGHRNRWVFISSGGTVYGHSDADRIREDHPTDPICTYGVAKLAIEKYFGIYGTLHGLDHVIVRLANPYGPWQYPGRGQGVIANLLAKALAREPIQIWGDGGQVRDYIYVRDAVDGVVSLATMAPCKSVLNIGSGEGYSLNSLIEVIGRELSMPIRIDRRPGRLVDVRRNVLDASGARELTGWSSKTPLGLGVQMTRSWISGTNLEKQLDGFSNTGTSAV